MLLDHQLVGRRLPTTIRNPMYLLTNSEVQAESYSLSYSHLTLLPPDFSPSSGPGGPDSRIVDWVQMHAGLVKF